MTEDLSKNHFDLKADGSIGHRSYQFAGQSDKQNNKRIYFNSVTGSIITDDRNEKEMYEVDTDDQRELEENQIDQYTDVSEKDKNFYKIWNKFIKSKDKCQIYMEKYLLEFVQINGQLLFEKELQECLLLHLTCLFDYSLINKNAFINVVNEMLQIKNGVNNKY